MVAYNVHLSAGVHTVYFAWLLLRGEGTIYRVLYIWSSVSVSYFLFVLTLLMADMLWWCACVCARMFVCDLLLLGTVATCAGLCGSLRGGGA